jgi:hypothetical protein
MQGLSARNNKSRQWKTTKWAKEERQAASQAIACKNRPDALAVAPQTPDFNKALACFSIALTGQQGRLDSMDFQTRRMFQQTIYLLQMLGTDFGYEFDLTIVGVYSKRLGQDLRDRYG